MWSWLGYLFFRYEKYKLFSKNSTLRPDDTDVYVIPVCARRMVTRSLLGTNISDTEKKFRNLKLYVVQMRKAKIYINYMQIDLHNVIYLILISCRYDRSIIWLEIHLNLHCCSYKAWTLLHALCNNKWFCYLYWKDKLWSVIQMYKKVRNQHFQVIAKTSSIQQNGVRFSDRLHFVV